MNASKFKNEIGGANRPKVYGTTVKPKIIGNNTTSNHLPSNEEQKESDTTNPGSETKKDPSTNCMHGI